MLKDIPELTVEDIVLAIVREQNEQGEDAWNVYLVNLKEETIKGVLVTSKGYGTFEGREVKTSILRHFLDEIPPKSFAKIEPIMTRLFGLSNEYWISFYLSGAMYDKKYVFLPETIQEEYFTHIPVINKPGVMLR